MNNHMRIILLPLLVLAVSSMTHAQIPAPLVHVVLFTHIEDNTPAAEIGTPQARQQYVATREGLLEMARLAKRHDVRWVFQPDWKLLLAALAYEDARMRENTADKNLLRYLREDLGVAIDPHSHEKQGYNYTDVAHLLDSLGVGGSTVIGGHIWDPSLPQFQGWDRFRSPVPGQRFPWARWRGDILMGSGTPNHTSDPHPSGVWRPKDRDNYWTDDPRGNIFCVGQYTGDVDGVVGLTELYGRGVVDAEDMLTASIHILPADISRPGGLETVEDSIIEPLAALRDLGKIVITDFSSLVESWKADYASRPHVFFSAPGPVGKRIETFVPSDAGGAEGIYVEITVPDTARYPEGAPVVVHVAGGWGADGLSVARDAETRGFVEVRFNFPGGGPVGKRSGGVYDDRGELCARATRDVLRFAMGRIPDATGRFINDLAAPVLPLSGNVGLCGWSNGGNTVLTTAGSYAAAVKGLAWLVNWESPVGDGMPGVEAGGKLKPNPAYDATDGSWDLSTLAFSDTLLISRPGDPALHGGLYFDLDRSGRAEAAVDHLLSPVAVRVPATRVYYSERLRNEAEARGLIPSAGGFPHLASAAETALFWQWRNGARYIAAAVGGNPGLMAIVAASDSDHVQGAPDHPHVLLQYEMLIDAGARFVRLNPDRVYCESVGARAYPRASDNDAFATFTRATIGTHLEPEGAFHIRDGVYTAAAVVELADRVRAGVLRRNLDSTIAISTTTDIDAVPHASRYRIHLSSNPLRENGTLTVTAPASGNVTTRVFDLMGRMVAVVADRWFESGTHVLSIPRLKPGYYIVSMVTDRSIVSVPFLRL